MKKIAKITLFVQKSECRFTGDKLSKIICIVLKHLFASSACSIQQSVCAHFHFHLNFQLRYIHFASISLIQLIIHTRVLTVPLRHGCRYILRVNINVFGIAHHFQFGPRYCIDEMLVKRTSTKNWWVNIFNRFIISQQYTAFLYVRLSTSVVFRQHSHTTCTALIIPFVHFLWKLSPYITCFFIFICRQRKIVRHSANKAYFPFFCLFTHLMNIHGSYNIQQLELFTFRQRLKEFDLI